MAALFQSLVSLLGLQATVPAVYSISSKPTLASSSVGHVITSTNVKTTLSTVRTASVGTVVSAASTRTVPSSGSKMSQPTVTVSMPSSKSGQSLVSRSTSNILSAQSVVSASTRSIQPTVSESTRLTKSTSSLLIASSKSIISSVSASSVQSMRSANSASAVGTVSIKTLSGSTSSSRVASQVPSKSRASGSVAPSIVTGTSACSYTTITELTTPLTTSTYYSNVTFTGPGQRAIDYPFIVSTITTVSTVNIASTLTLTSTSIPPSLQGVIATYTEPAPAGFIPVQSSLPSAVYLNAIGGPNPFNPAKKARAARRAAVRAASGSAYDICVSTITSISTVPTSTITITDTEPVGAYVYTTPLTTLYQNSRGSLIGISSPYSTVTYVSTSLVTAYASTTVSTTTLTAPASTTTFYAACATNNFADYIQYSNGTTDAIQAVAQPNQIINIVNTETAYDCCAYNMANNGSVWLFLLETSGGICGIMSPSGYPTGTCLNQNNPDARFSVLLYTKVNVAGNGYCGQLTGTSRP